MTDTELHEPRQVIANIEEMRRDRQRYYDVAGDAVDMLFAEAATAIAQLIERNEALEKSDVLLASALERCRSLFREIRLDWTDPRSETREGIEIIDIALECRTALSASLE